MHGTGAYTVTDVSRARTRATCTAVQVSPLGVVLISSFSRAAMARREQPEERMASMRSITRRASETWSGTSSLLALAPRCD